MKTFLIIVGIVIVAIIIYVLFFSNRKVRKQQKQAEILGWEFVRMVKTGKYQDYMYSKKGVIAVLSWQQGDIFCSGKSYANFADIENELNELSENLPKKKKYSEDVIHTMLAIADNDVRSLMMSKDDSYLYGLRNGIDMHFRRNNSTYKAARHLVKTLRAVLDGTLPPNID